MNLPIPSSFQKILLMLFVNLSIGFVCAQSSGDESDIQLIKPPPRNVKDILTLVEQTKPDLLQLEKAKKL